MALPVNAPQITCTLSKPLQANGAVGMITSAQLSMSRSLVWTESGETIYEDPVSVIPSTEAPQLSFQVIAVDAEGIVDLVGNAITDLTYTLRVSLRLNDNVSRVVSYTFTPVEADGPTIDLDLHPQDGFDG